MKFYGNDPFIPGSQQLPEVSPAPAPAMATPKPRRPRRVEKVVDGIVVETYATVIRAAAAMLVSQPTMTRWMQSGKINRGAVWRYEKE